MKLAVLGDPLAYTRSPDLHRALERASQLVGDRDPFGTRLRVMIQALHDRLRDDHIGFVGAHPAGIVRRCQHRMLVDAGVVRELETARLAAAVDVEADRPRGPAGRVPAERSTFRSASERATSW